MRFLIDTHCFLWAISAPERLNEDAKEMITSDDHTGVLSSISAAEIAVKVSIGKLQAAPSAYEYVQSEIDDFDLQTLPLYVHHGLRVAELPLHHRDPFDRLLVAQAQAEGLPLMTADPKLAKYDVEIIWAGKDPAPSGVNSAGGG